MVRRPPVGYDFSKRISVATQAVLRQDRACPEMADVLERSLRHAGRSEIGPDEIEDLGVGWVGEECLLIGTVAAMMDVAANHGGDSDSTASVAGQIMGARYGRSALEPAHTVEDVFRNLDVARPMSYLLDRFGKAIDQVN